MVLPSSVNVYVPSIAPKTVTVCVSLLIERSSLLPSQIARPGAGVAVTTTDTCESGGRVSTTE